MTEDSGQLHAHIEELYQRDGDPWRVRERWYEQRKRSLVLAALPHARYRNAYEPGCGNGEMTLALAARCDRLLAADASGKALELTRERLRGAHTGCELAVERHRLPQDWPRTPGQRFDLILISELAYYLNHGELAQAAQCAVQSLAPGGALVLCHWRAPFGDQAQSTPTVHAAFDAMPQLHRLLRHEEDDFLLEVWSNDARSVTQRERAST
jgi:SAM-dependent methyltransferase